MVTIAPASTNFSSRYLVGNSQAIRDLRQELTNLGRFKFVTVLLTGETGVGKQEAARFLHDATHLNQANQANFIVANLATIAPTMIEREMFGSLQGAYTDAKIGMPGFIQGAGRGTLFLDEIGTVNDYVQQRLLLLLDTDRQYIKIGSNMPETSEARIIIASGQDLELAVEQGKFREDLYYRLNDFVVKIPPLRERKEDIPILARHFLTKFATRNRDTQEHGFSVEVEVIRRLCEYSWPGNARQLNKFICQAAIRAFGRGDRVVSIQDCPSFEKVRLDESLKMTKIGGDFTVDEVVKAHIHTVLDRCGWRINSAGNAAEKLGMHPNTLRFRMNKLGIVRHPSQRRTEEDVLSNPEETE